MTNKIKSVGQSKGNHRTKALPLFLPRDTLLVISACMTIRARKYDIETGICYHGGIYKENANKRLAELAKTHLKRFTCYLTYSVGTAKKSSPSSW